MGDGRRRKNWKPSLHGFCGPWHGPVHTCQICQFVSFGPTLSESHADISFLIFFFLTNDSVQSGEHYYKGWENVNTLNLIKENHNPPSRQDKRLILVWISYYMVLCIYVRVWLLSS